ncbi:RTA1-like protein [Favolaschia claudopus]|uniref:RTA1-like protein n=1 Tax=Favolaschia claudopus TaxID=2862362 RepID=A0AAW0EAE9_9AGAR
MWLAAFTPLPALIARASASSHRFNPYHYVPTEWICVAFVVLFALSSALHLGQSIRYRIWWLLPTAFLSGLLEVLGWSARLWSSFNPTLLLPFEIQVIGTIIGPTPLIAADFMILGRIIHRLGTRYSRLSPKWYSIIFCTCDLISLSVQGFGGTVASLAVGRSQSPEHGAHIMLFGIIFQMLTISIYILLASEFLFRFFTDRPLRGGVLGAGEDIDSLDDHHALLSNSNLNTSMQSARSSTSTLITAYPPAKAKKDSSMSGMTGRRAEIDAKLRFMIAALGFNTVCLLIRAIYRTIELLDGFSGPIISTERYFNVLDGGMITLAIFTLNIAHPGVYLVPQENSDRDKNSKQSEVERKLKAAGLLYYRL